MSKASRGRFSDELDPFDFNARQATTRGNTRKRQLRAADRLTKTVAGRKSLTEFFRALDQASDNLSAARETAVRQALGAVISLLEATNENQHRWYSRPFDVLLDNIERGAGARGLHSDDQEHQIKAATAFLVDYLAAQYGQGRTVRLLCKDAAIILTERNFRFRGSKVNPKGKLSKNALLKNRADAIEHWRRDFPKKGGVAGEIFRHYRDCVPFRAPKDAKQRRHVALSWWYGKLSENGY